MPEPTPIKISKSSNDLTQNKNISLYLKQNIRRNSNNYFNYDYNNYFNSNGSSNYLNSDYNKYFNSNDISIYFNNNNSLVKKSNKYVNNENIKTDYYLKDNLTNYYTNTFVGKENNGLLLNQNLSKRNYNNINNDSNINTNNNDINNENDDNKLKYILQNLNISFLINEFKANYISFYDLFLLTREDLVEMKIPIGPRNKIIHFIQEYKKHMKSFEFSDLTNFFFFYKNNNLLTQEQKIENNFYSTTQTTNEFSNRIKINQNTNNFFSNEKNENSYYITKENFNPNQNNSNYSLLNSPLNYIKTSLDKNSINLIKRNSSTLRNLKTTSYINQNIKYHKNNSVICKDKIFKPIIKKEKINNKNNGINTYKYNKIENKNNFQSNKKKHKKIKTK